MSWLQDRETACEYTCKNGHTEYWEGNWEYRPPSIQCAACGELAEYSGFAPDKISSITRVSYDQNGRQAYRIKRPDGSVYHVSKTSYEYYRTGKVKHYYTKPYEEAKSARERETVAKVSGVKPKDRLD